MRKAGILIKFYLLYICHPADSKHPTRIWRKNDIVNWLQEKGAGDCDNNRIMLYCAQFHYRRFWLVNSPKTPSIKLCTVQHYPIIIK